MYRFGKIKLFSLFIHVEELDETLQRDDTYLVPVLAYAVGLPGLSFDIHLGPASRVTIYIVGSAAKAAPWSQGSVVTVT